MTTWNYRLISQDHTYTTAAGTQAETLVTMHEVYYNNEGQIDGYIAAGSSPLGDTVDEVGAVLQLMAEALGKPILVFNDDGLLVEPT